MCAVSIRTRPYRDAVGRAHHRAVVIRTATATLGVVALLGAGAWLFLFSPVFRITQIIVSGVAAAGDERIHASIDELLAEKRLYIFQPARNILLLDTAAMTRALREQFAVIASVTAQKEYPHTIRVTVVERQPLGIWCHEQECVYFDGAGERWGRALPSHGPLLLAVQDERPASQSDDRLTAGLLQAAQDLPPLGLHALTVRLPNEAPGDIRLMTDRHIELILDGLGDIADQLATLGVLLADRAHDQSWAPQYIDLRTPGRVYYK